MGREGGAGSQGKKRFGWGQDGVVMVSRVWG